MAQCYQGEGQVGEPEAKEDSFYTNTDLASLEAFMQLVDDDKNNIKWTTNSPEIEKYSLKKYEAGVSTEYTMDGKNKVPISRSTVSLDFNINTDSYMKLLLNDKKRLQKFYLNAHNVDVIHEYNQVTQISQFQLGINTLGVSPRDFIVKESGFYVDSENKKIENSVQLELFLNSMKNEDEKETENTKSKFIKSKVIYIIRSICSEDKHYKMAKKGHVRGTMYRSGVLAENLGKNKSKLTVIMEYETNGSGMVSWLAKRIVPANSSTYDICKAGKGIVSLFNATSK